MESDELQKVIEEKKFIENSVSVGEGEDNLSVMPDGFWERRDYEQYFFTRENIETYINKVVFKKLKPKKGKHAKKNKKQKKK